MKIESIFDKNNASNSPYIIAEAGVNHECDIDKARQLIYSAAEGGADAIKFQTYKAEKLAVKDSPAYWSLEAEPTSTQFELFKKYDKFWKSDYEMLKIECDKAKIEFLSTPFDLESAKFLNDLVPAFKISSSDITNKPLITLVSKFMKPVIISTGASNLFEIKRALEWVKASGNDYVSLLHCVLSYPTRDEDANLSAILELAKHFEGTPIGYSDHTLPKDMLCLEVASMLGAKIIEKHFTLDKSLPGNDHYHSMDRKDLLKYKSRMARVQKLLGKSGIEVYPCEQQSRLNARRSLVYCKNLQENEVITVDDLIAKRPGTGVCPSQIDFIDGKKLKRAVKEDTMLTLEDLFL